MNRPGKWMLLSCGALIPPRRLAPLFLALSLFHLLPIWRVPYLPTVDGPSHLYNAVVLAEPTAEMERVFSIDARPHPNWATHLLLAAAVRLLPLVVAEKVVVSAIVVLFLGGIWTLAGVVDPRSRGHAFLVMPLAFHLLFQMGFYNYSLGVALVPFAVASWWHRRAQSTWTSIGRTALWLLVLYFTHVIAVVAAMLFLAVLWGFTMVCSRERSQWRHGVAFLPAAALLLWFFLQPKPPGGTWTWKGALLFSPLSNTALLLTFDLKQLAWGTALAVVLGLLLVGTVWIEIIRGRRGFSERDVFLFLTMLGVVLFVAAPLSVEEGLVLKARLLIFPYLLVLPWLSPRLVTRAGVVLMALAVAANVFFQRDAWKRNAKVMEAAIAPLAAAETGRTIVPLMFDRSSPHATLSLLSHAMDYRAAERRLVHLGNYEAGLPFFPVQFRNDVERPSIFSLETDPGGYDVARWAPIVDYVYSWKMPADAPVAQKLAEQYDLVASEGEARLYRRR